MDTIQAIMTRRSVRRYTTEPVTETQLDVLLRAAMRAPSACNQQPWHFVVVTDAELLRRIPEVNPYAGMARSAPAAIVVCADPKLQQMCPGFWPQDCAAAIENLLLAAHASGLGAVWTAVHPDASREQRCREIFGIPEDVVPVGTVVLGHPAETPAPLDTYQADRIHRNGW